MKATSIRAIILLFIIFLSGPPSIYAAGDYEALKARIQTRAEAIAGLKQLGVIREGGQGMLEPTASGMEAAQTQLVEDENGDRGLMFQLIAASSGKQPAEVVAAFSSMSGRASATPAAPVSTPSSPTSPQPTVAPVNPVSPQNGKPIRMEGSVLPMKVITRPLSAIYLNPSEISERVKENTPAFTVFYVYAKENGWYAVGENNRGKTLGWMKAADLVEWKQNLVVEFTHPEGRNPVMLFQGKNVLSGIVSAAPPARKKAIGDLFDAINKGNLSPDFPVTSMEPRRSVKSQDQFYLLPIIDSDEIQIQGYEGRLLQVAAATRLRGASNLHDDQELKQLNQATNARSGTAKQVAVDLVFVMDLTRSMGPFAERTLQMMRDIARRIGADQEVINAVRFGFWGYRDFPESCPGIEYNTRNYTPQLQMLPDFVNTLKTVRETRADSIDYPEDMVAGVSDAINQTQWRPGATRLVVLVGDAPGRNPGETDPLCKSLDRPIGTKCGMDVESLRKVADQANVYVTSLYLNTPKWGMYADAGSRQFEALAHNPNQQGSQGNFRLLDAADPSIYGATAEAVGQGIMDSILYMQGRGGSDPMALASPSGGVHVTSVEQGQAAGAELARNMFRGAVTEWLGKKDAATVPRDITAWVADKDIVDPAIQSLEVKVFLTKSELNGLKLALDQLLSAGVRGQISGEGLFQALQAVVATASRDPAQVRNASTLAQTGLIPEFLKGLPYKSTIMDMSNETWARMSPDQQDKYLQKLQSKLNIYQTIHDNSAKWQPLNDGDDRDNWVAAIPLDSLP